MIQVQVVYFVHGAGIFEIRSDQMGSLLITFIIFPPVYIRPEPCRTDYS